MAGMTPERPVQKRRVISPLHEMDGDDTHDDELVGTPKSNSDGSDGSGPSLDAIAAVVRQEIQTAIELLESKLTAMGATFDDRVAKIETAVNDQDVRIARLENLMAKDPPETTPLLNFEDKISDLQCQIDILKRKPRSNEGEMCKTMVVGGLQAFESLQVATKWLRDKLETLKVQIPSETYMKAQSSNGVLFAKFSSSYDRDIAIATLRSANIKHDHHHIWATQDLPIPTRARKMFLLGLRWQLGEWGFVKREIEIDEHYTKMTIAGKTVVQVTSTNGEFLVEWANGWAAWDEFQSCTQLQQIMDRAKVVMKKQGKGTGKSKHTGATPSH